MKRCILLVVIGMCVALAGCQTIEKEEQREEKIEVNATVTDMQYERGDITLKTKLYGIKVRLIPEIHFAHHLVTISYEDVSETFDDSNLYERVEEGDTIQMVLYKVYDKDDNLIKQTLQFPE